MANIQVNVVHVATGANTKVEIPDNIPVRDLLPKLVKAVSGDVQTSGGSRLMNKSQSFDYHEGDTLAGRGTKPNDTLGLVQEFQAGSFWPSDK